MKVLQLFDKSDFGEDILEWEGSAKEFIDGNGDMFDEEEIDAVNNLNVGETINYGGGAAPDFILRRIV